MGHSEVQWGTVRYSEVQCGAVRYSGVKCDSRFALSLALLGFLGFLQTKHVHCAEEFFADPCLR